MMNNEYQLEESDFQKKIHTRKKTHATTLEYSHTFCSFYLICITAVKILKKISLLFKCFPGSYHTPFCVSLWGTAPCAPSNITLPPTPSIAIVKTLWHIRQGK